LTDSGQFKLRASIYPTSNMMQAMASSLVETSFLITALLIARGV